MCAPFFTERLERPGRNGASAMSRTARAGAGGSSRGPTKMHSIDLFSGCGGNAYALSSVATPAMYCEVADVPLKVLRAAMKRGDVPTAPVSRDVKTIMKTKEYAAAKKLRPLLVTGSWPCQVCVQPIARASPSGWVSGGWG